MKSTIKSIISIACFTLLLVSCEKEDTKDSLNSYDFTFSNDSIYNINETTLGVDVEFTTTTPDKMYDIGVYYSEEGSNPLVDGCIYQSFEKKGTKYTLKISQLTPNRYYIIEFLVMISQDGRKSIGNVQWKRWVYKHGKLSPSGNVKDIDGNTYNYITLGNQTWMTENLRTKHTRTGELIPMGISTYSGYSFYNNDTSNIRKYGLIYCPSLLGSQLCPAGWHIPTPKEWHTLEKYLIANGYNFDQSKTGNKAAKSLASTSSDWTVNSANNPLGCITNDISKNNTSGFTALPGGYLDFQNIFREIGMSANFWALQDGGAPPIGFQLKSTLAETTLTDFYFANGMYIRCIRDN